MDSKRQPFVLSIGSSVVSDKNQSESGMTASSFPYVLFKFSN